MRSLSKTSGQAPEGGAAKLTKRQMQAIETKNKIYHAAIAVINEKGFHNVSIEDITSSANVAKGSFYTYFESKEAVVLYTLQQSDEMYGKAYEKVKDEDFFPMIVDFVRISYEEYEKRGKGIIKAIVSNYFTFTDYNFYNDDRNLLQCLRLIVEKGKTQNVLDEQVPTRSYVNLLLSAMVGVEVMWCMDHQGNGLSDMIADAIEVTAKGMMRQPAATPGQIPREA